MRTKIILQSCACLCGAVLLDSLVAHAVSIGISGTISPDGGPARAAPVAAYRVGAPVVDQVSGDWRVLGGALSSADGTYTFSIDAAVGDTILVAALYSLGPHLDYVYRRIQIELNTTNYTLNLTLPRADGASESGTGSIKIRVFNEYGEIDYATHRLFLLIVPSGVPDNGRMVHIVDTFGDTSRELGMLTNGSYRIGCAEIPTEALPGDTMVFGKTDVVVADGMGTAECHLPSH